jgi:flagellar basal-body rod protein FlgB
MNLFWTNDCIDLRVFDQIGASLEKYMTVLSVRQRVVASNIANADTPGYRTKDIDFQAALRDATDGILPQAQDVEGLKIKNDGNNVNLDREARLLSETDLRFSVASQLVRSEIKSIRSAIDEGRNG